MSRDRPPIPPQSLSVVLPCRNEEGNVARVIDEVIRDVAPLVPRLEIVVVDDGSTDGTRSIAESRSRADPRVRVVHHPTGRGYGGALVGGFRATSSDWVFYTDGDGQFEPAQLALALPLLERADVVVGFRSPRAEGWTRRLNGWLWTRLVAAVFGLKVRDVDCAFKVFPGWFVRESPLVSGGALISAELLARAGRAGMVIRQFPVRHHARSAGRATGASVRVIVRAFVELVVLSRRIRRDP